MQAMQELVLPFFRAMGLEEQLLDPEVSELMVTNRLVFIEKSGCLSEVVGLTVEEKQLKACVEIIAQSVNDVIDDYYKPYLDARLPDGSRVAAVYPPMSPQGVILTIRKFFRDFTTAELIERGALSTESHAIIMDAIEARKNILVSGGTSTGKTTLTNALVQHIPPQERIIVIEKPMEMKIRHRNSPRLEAYPQVGDRPESTVSRLLSMSLRHRPDRIIVGEVKDSEAAYGLLQAMNTGHDGTISTIHSNTGLSALNRLASLAMPGFGSLDLSRQETAAAINVVVEVKRDRSGWRGVNQIFAVGEYDDRSRTFDAEPVYRRNA